MIPLPTCEMRYPIPARKKIFQEVVDFTSAEVLQAVCVG